MRGPLGCLLGFMRCSEERTAIIVLPCANTAERLQVFAIWPDGDLGKDPEESDMLVHLFRGG